jgi:hypothetical protein
VAVFVTRTARLVSLNIRLIVGRVRRLGFCTTLSNGYAHAFGLVILTLPTLLSQVCHVRSVRGTEPSEPVASSLSVEEMTTNEGQCEAQNPATVRCGVLDSGT